MKQKRMSFCVTCVTMYPFSGISYEKIVQKKDPGNGMQCDASAGPGGGRAYEHTQTMEIIL